MKRVAGVLILVAVVLLFVVGSVVVHGPMALAAWGVAIVLAGLVALGAWLIAS